MNLIFDESVIACLLTYLIRIAECVHSASVVRTIYYGWKKSNAFAFFCMSVDKSGSTILL